MQGPVNEIPPRRVLVVEDDHAIGREVVRALKRASYRVELATNGLTGQERALSGEFDLVVLDLGLPGRDGLDVLDSCQSRLSTPIIVLTAQTSVHTRLDAFERGADDYLPKPFFTEELLARVRARLRAPPPQLRRAVSFAGATVDLDARTVEVGGEPADLTACEFNLLAHLLSRPGRPASRSQLLDAALDPGGDVTERTVDSHMARIRKKLGPGAAAHVETVFRVGYRFNPNREGR